MDITQGIPAFNGDGIGIPYASPSLAFSGVALADPLSVQRAGERESWEQARFSELSSLEAEMLRSGFVTDASVQEAARATVTTPSKLPDLGITRGLVNAWEEVKKVPTAVGGVLKDARNLVTLALVVVGLVAVARIVRG